MENHQILSKSKLDFSASFREAFKILFNHPNFISLIIFLSLPLLASLSAHNILLHPTFIQFLRFLSHKNPYDPSLTSIIMCQILEGTACFSQLSSTLSHGFLISIFVSSALIFFLDLLNTIAIVSISASLYGGNSQMGFKEMLVQVRKMVALKLRGSLATSLCSVLLASLTLLGLVALSKDFFLMATGSSHMSITNTFLLQLFIFTFIFGTPFVVLLGKYVEWSAVWNMGIVISILDKNQGYIAIGVASYLSRGSRKLGFSLMMVFFVLKMVFGFPCLYALWNERSCGVWENVVFVSLNGVGNVVMWVVLMVYFYDCKRELLEKKIDLENNGKPIEAVQQ
ncbi:uncharacterized protein LOC111481871 [Cucurbita maxima]|uniref:Uncharacterized protein LOC111481871 n=1 Tax=Cucurbita maxima TaxID=3661 RepID=A0A6J1J592_CUCMA|nr:uncharacterized protein LOC111481871 [Cucurbita maxima]